MPNYAEMYRVLFRAMTKAIAILQDAQQQTEEMYISNEDPVITILTLNNGEKEDDGYRE